ncbi:MAG: major facilitator superfamily domain-containing protein 1 [Proteobacteria bacterium]|nr:major facilitator superfamily domain-containing protein 1 [Pseudomonadota bacterium]
MSGGGGSGFRPAVAGQGAARWWVLALLSLAIAGSYYEYDAIAPIADFLRAERGFTQAQIGMLNAVFSLPNIFLALLGGVLIDRYGPARVATWTAALCLAGAALTAIGSPYAVMVTGRLIFGVAEEALFIALLAGLAQWFSSGGTALAMALFFSFARIGSYAADTSPDWGHAVYAHGWQQPLWLAAAATAASFAAALVYRVIDARARASGRLPAAAAPERITWSDLVSFNLSYWYILALNVLFAAVFFPFRSTFAIEYFQDAKGLTLQQAGLANSWVFFAAIFATPVFGFLADRVGRRSLMMMIATLLMPLVFLILGTTDWSLWISTALMGISFSVVPAVIWPSTAMLVEPRRLGTAFGLINLLQNLFLAASNLTAGWLADRAHAGPAHPAGYEAMLWYFGLLSLVAFVSVALLWRRESGPRGHGLERRSEPSHVSLNTGVPAAGSE